MLWRYYTHLRSSLQVLRILVWVCLIGRGLLILLFFTSTLHDSSTLNSNWLPTFLLSRWSYYSSLSIRWVLLILVELNVEDVNVVVVALISSTFCSCCIWYHSLHWRIVCIVPWIVQSRWPFIKGLHCLCSPSTKWRLVVVVGCLISNCPSLMNYLVYHWRIVNIRYCLALLAQIP